MNFIDRPFMRRNVTACDATPNVRVGFGDLSDRCVWCSCRPPAAVNCPRLIDCLEALRHDFIHSDVPSRSPGWKRVLDCLLLFLSMPAWLPLMGIIALAIKCTSKGPVLFKQTRVGFRGTRFTCLKFRTMKSDASPVVHETHLKSLIGSDDVMTKMDSEDERLIGIGRLLRASGLDEIPQFVNVLRGEMSLVGPRPCTEYEYALHSAWQKQRFHVPPGLTGLWQVSGKNSTSFTQMICLDLYYARNCSLAVDLRIMSRTIGVLLRQTGNCFPKKQAVFRPKSLSFRKSVTRHAQVIDESV